MFNTCNNVKVIAQPNQTREKYPLSDKTLILKTREKKHPVPNKDMARII